MSVATLSSWVPQEHLHAKLGAAPVAHSIPSQQLKSETPTVDTTSIASQVDAHQHAGHDPHHLPVFDGTTLTAPSQPILYLPPLLSSLPPGYSHPPETAGTHRPLSTETRLPDIDPVSLLLHKALHHFPPVTDQYAETPFEHAFNWPELALPEDAEREWYAVVFQSKRKEGSDGGRKYIIMVLCICMHTHASRSSLRGR